MDVTNLAQAERAEASEAAHWASLVEGLAALPGNPYGAVVRRFGHVVAMACPGMPTRSYVNRVMLAGPGDVVQLDEAIEFLRAQGLRVRVDVSPFHADDDFLKHLARQSFHPSGFAMTLAGRAAAGGAAASGAAGLAAAPPGIEVRLAETAEQIEFIARSVPVVFGSRGHWLQWLGDSARATVGPQWRNYVAYVDGVPAGFGQLHMVGGIGSLVQAGTLPEFRGRGIQTALIHRRIADAAVAGCDLICTQTGVGTVSQHNMERIGLRVAYTKTEFYDR